MVVERSEQGQGVRVRLKQLCSGWVLGSHAGLANCPQRGSIGPELVRVTWDRAVCALRVQKAQEGPHH